MQQDPATILIALDVGATGIKTVSAELTENGLHVRNIHSEPSVPRVVNGHEYVDVPLMIDCLEKAVREEAGECSSLSVGIDTYGNGYGALDEHDQLLHLPWYYRDRRTDDILKTVNSYYSDSEMYRMTGNFPIRTRGLFILLQDVLDQDPVITEGRTLLPLPNLIEFLLTGKKGAEETIASVLYLTEKNGTEWNYEAIRSFGIPEKLFLPLQEPGRELGYIDRGLSDDLIEKKIRLLNVIGHDTESALITIPDLDENSAFLCTGTSFIVGTRRRTPLVTDETYKSRFKNMRGAFGWYSLCKDFPGFWLQERILEEWNKEKCSSQPAFSYEEFNRLAAEGPEQHMFLDPGDDVFRVSESSISETIREFCIRTGQNPPQTKAETAISLYESYCCYVRRNIEELERINGRPVERLYVLNGGVRNPMLLQMLADAIGKPVEATSRYASAFGNLLMQYYVLRNCSSAEDLRKPAESLYKTVTYQCCEERSKYWETQYERYMQLKFL